jgi:hypothetical protein
MQSRSICPQFTYYTGSRYNLKTLTVTTLDATTTNWRGFATVRPPSLGIRAKKRKQIKKNKEKKGNEDLQ